MEIRQGGLQVLTFVENHTYSHTMDSILEKPICLSLNRNWVALGFLTPKQALVAMCGGVYGGTPPALALDLAVNEAGGLEYATPVDWNTWLRLPVRDGDLSLSTARGAIRCPLVVIRPGFAKQPLKTPRLSRNAILERDGFTCAYSGKRLPKEKLNIDHVIPRSRGGNDCWSNLVACDVEINFRKGNKLNPEAGLVLGKNPVEPKPVPVAVHLSAKMREHGPFLFPKDIRKA